MKSLDDDTTSSKRRVIFWFEITVKKHRKLRWKRTLIGLLPFILWALFQFVLGSSTGLIATAQGLVILSLVLLLGNRLRQYGVADWATATIQSSILYWLILPQDALFFI